MLKGDFSSNWKGKLDTLDTLLTRKERMAVPCGTGRQMVEDVQVIAVAHAKRRPQRWRARRR
jgi:hypothetical protein